MIFLTVGTQFGFDRLVKAVDDMAKDGNLKDDVVAQIGPGKYIPTQMDYMTELEKDKFDELFHSCDAIISHAGIGNISLAIRHHKPLLVLPRRKRYGEVVNDHQVDTAMKFEQNGHILAAYDTDELADKIKCLKTFSPKLRTANRQQLIERIAYFLESL